MTEDTVTVEIQVPKALHAFVEKLAALEGSKPSDFYELWILRDFEANADAAIDGEAFDLDMEQVIKNNGLVSILKDP